ASFVGWTAWSPGQVAPIAGPAGRGGGSAGGRGRSTPPPVRTRWRPDGSRDAGPAGPAAGSGLLFGGLGAHGLGLGGRRDVAALQADHVLEELPDSRLIETDGGVSIV